MSREQYTPPSFGGTGAGGAGASSSGQNQNYSTSAFNFSGSIPDDTSRPVSYLCGECDAKVSLKKGDAIRCKECGYRVLYKERTNRMIQFEAR